MNDVSTKLRGGIYGLLVGDALGVPYEFHSRDAIPPYDQIEFDPPKGFDRSHQSVRPGTWSDDGAQALCLLESLLECDKFDPDDLGRRLLDWYGNGYLAIDNDVFDVGITTSSALARLRTGTPAVNAGPCTEYDNGNGALMRVLPLALWHLGTDAELIHDACLQSRVTHGHLRSQICCALYCVWARNILREKSQPWPDALRSVEQALVADPLAKKELDGHIRPVFEQVARGSGYVVDSLGSALILLKNDSYEKVVRAAIQLGDDTDTTACIAGGIAGLQWGEKSIPERWLKGLRGKVLVEPLLARLVKRVSELQGT